ncbi:MAG: ribonuclease P protein component [Gemmatimonadetes bacterium]|uniref:Ribonuclease P protein component n=1 Tax=Candidatus Kutchimonas denitrificans TaxID=3056748 RepID=A0AAE4Z6X6_9BACT|nr:ribonuclease P protein component [Gemmatimonadota bacterium]NIR74128.1 ribonuclease P protein component [Candidatus Kutchimonas denitrificans]NIS01310.1 ribonuclease P protein component [Gemmatimonadota bacterium]NIT67041.1 ribonuclease P protein component [Gemmatimonadota bacterium]NIU51701.1 ribonuclease P protein component [Gemmatimonadota bacterium]
MRRRSEIQALIRRGKRRRTEHLDVFVTESPALRSRLALVVPKHGRAIVQRNRLTRRLREVARRHLLPPCREGRQAVDILIRARPEAYRAEFDQLREEISQLAEQLCSPGSS